MKIQMRLLLSIVSLIACMSFFPAGKQVVAGPLTVPGTGDTAVGDPSFIAFAAEEELYFLKDLSSAIDENKTSPLVLGKTKQDRKIEAYYFPGVSDRRALVIGGMHGSELSSIEVSDMLVQLLHSEERPYYSVLIIPCLFPDNAAVAAASPGLIGDPLNIGRYSLGNGVDPNRQMPSPGTPFDESRPLDHAGRIIEKENQLLLRLVDFFKPARIANLHAIRQTNYGGVYADPRTDEHGMALGYTSDSSLALSIAKYIYSNGGNVAGNRLHKNPTAVYYKDPVPATTGQLQKRNMMGSALNGHRGSGVSLGTWGITAIRQAIDTTANRGAMRVITIEFPGAKRPTDHKTMQSQKYWRQQVNVFAEAIETIFLGRNQLEQFENDKQFENL